ncbi:MAG: amidohydrolase family protein [Cyclobacteriaceae bacterium]|nr:amidohydrolase family protein [Cyclobacteriaceae bacterium]
MNDQIKVKIDVLLHFLRKNKDHLVIDADTHVTELNTLSGAISKLYQTTPNYFHGRPISAEDLLKEMNLAGVDMSLIWQNPSTLEYYQEDLDGNYEKLLKANRNILNAFLQHPTRFIPAGWTDPKALGVHNALKLIEVLIQEFGFFIVKMNPAQNAYPLFSDGVVKCVERIVALGGVPAFHFGADTIYTPPEDLEKIAELHLETPILAVHMGGGGASYLEAEETYLKTRELGLRMPNIKFILSAKRDTHIESDLITYQLAGAPFKHNIFCASDAPYGRQSWNFGGYDSMFKSLMNGKLHTDQRLQENHDAFSQEDVNNYLGGNFARFIIEWYEKFLIKQMVSS